MADTLQMLRSQVAAGQRATEDDRAREERIANCEMEFSDGFLSSWAAGLTQAKGRIAADLLERGGKSWFFRFELVDAETGAAIDAKLIDGAYGLVWIIDGADAQTYGRFITAHAKRKATMARKGVAERIVIFEADALADIKGSGKGLSGAASCRAITRTADYDVKYDGHIGSRENVDAWLDRNGNGGYYAWQEKVIA